MRRLPRMRAWMFSSVTSSFIPLNAFASDRLYALRSGVIGIVRNSMPRCLASRCASRRVPVDEYADGIPTPATFSRPRHARLRAEERIQARAEDERAEDLLDGGERRHL